jgi:hypothetical protein
MRGEGAEYLNSASDCRGRACQVRLSENALWLLVCTWQLPNGKIWPITWAEMDRPPQR